MVFVWPSGARLLIIIECALINYCNTCFKQTGFSVVFFKKSCLGVYILVVYPQLQESHPLIFKYIALFSLKWIIAFIVTLLLLFCSVLIVRLCFQAEETFVQSIGALPIVYFFVILMSYMYSLFYGIIIMKEIYAP